MRRDGQQSRHCIESPPPLGPPPSHLCCSTGAGLQAPMLATFTALLAGGCALASYRNFRERLASATA